MINNCMNSLEKAEELKKRTKSFAIRIRKSLSFSASLSRCANSGKATLALWHLGGRELSRGLSRSFPG
jgi:hypothetical protein